MRPALVPILLADPLPWAKRAEYAWDFLRDRARFAGGYKGALANTPNWTFTRASTAYYRNASGVLVPFASGDLRYGDRGALIEGAGTNLCLQSQTFDNASWGKTNVTVTVDQVAAPDGTLTADKVTSAAAAGRLTQNITLTAAATYAFSIFLLGGTSAQSTLEVADLVGGDTQAQLVITWTAGVPSTSSSTGASSITYSALAGGWYRVSFTFAADAVNTNHQFQVKPDTAAGANYIYGWGAQLEAAAYASSYVPTTTGSATRAADSLTVTGVTELDYPLSLYAEFERDVDTGTDSGVLEVNAGSSADRALLNISTTDVIQFYARASFVDQVNNTIAGALATGTVYKVAARVSTNDSRQVLGGTLGTQDTSCTNPAAPTKIIFGEQNGGVSKLHGYLRRLALFSRALSDGELQALTAA